MHQGRTTVAALQVLQGDGFKVTAEPFMQCLSHDVLDVAPGNRWAISAASYCIESLHWSPCGQSSTKSMCMQGIRKPTISETQQWGTVQSVTGITCQVLTQVEHTRAHHGQLRVLSTDDMLYLTQHPVLRNPCHKNFLRMAQDSIMQTCQVCVTIQQLCTPTPMGGTSNT